MQNKSFEVSAEFIATNGRLHELEAICRSYFEESVSFDPEISLASVVVFEHHHKVSIVSDERSGIELQVERLTDVLQLYKLIDVIKATGLVLEARISVVVLHRKNAACTFSLSYRAIAKLQTLGLPVEFAVYTTP